MKHTELLRRLRRAAATRDAAFETSEGANHTKVQFGGRRTVIGRHSADLKTGTLNGILKRLGLTSEDIEG
jgi:mRNA interferase HicA